ncbi:MAG: PilW family protein [Aridibacter sp.]
MKHTKSLKDKIIKTDHQLSKTKKMEGYSLIELIFAMVLTLVILGIAVAAFSSALSTRQRELSKTDAITSAQAALNIMSREIGNSGYGLVDNGIVLTDSTTKQLHFRTNTNNSGYSYATDQPGEDVTFYFDAASQSVVRYDRSTGITSGIINRVSDVDFEYYNYLPDGTNTQGAASPTTGRVKIKLQVTLKDVQGQPKNQKVFITSDVTLRNSTYHLGQY